VHGEQVKGTHDRCVRKSSLRFWEGTEG
jgi:hypothetical protein